MRRPPPHQRDSDYGAMTSMIDIVFLLLIFFVVTASSQLPELLLPAGLASAGSVESAVIPPKPEPLTVEIWLKLFLAPDRSQTVVDMNGTQYRNLQEVKAQLRSLADLGPENPVILEIAGDVPLGDVVGIYDTCQGAGFHSINFAAGSRPEKPNAGSL